MVCVLLVRHVLIKPDRATSVIVRSIYLTWSRDRSIYISTMIARNRYQ
jgi:hypothetical protein